ncbi:MAG TPA: PAS domain S-box protein, partial [Solirubrobacterales bacterium]|nr:PAS domain S-box protein [Solirubrobacterales bacterium]
TIPVVLLALRFGVKGGLIGAATALTLYAVWASVDGGGVTALGVLNRGATYVLLATLVGTLARGLADSEERLDTALRNSPMMFFNYDRDLRCVWAHSQWTSMTPEEMIGRTEVELFGPKVGTPLMEMKRRVLETGEPARYEFETDAGPFGPRWFDATFEPIQNSRGAIVGVSCAAMDITDAKRMQKELTDSEERFRTAIESLLEPYGVFSAVRGEDGTIIDFRVEFINQPACETIGSTQEELVDQMLSEIFPGRLEGGLLQQYAITAETGVPYFRDALDYVNVFGTDMLIRAVDIRVSKIGDGVGVAWRDITDRVRHEKGQGWLAAIVENAADAVLSFDLDGKIVTWSGGAERLYGFSADEAIGMHYSALIPPEHAELSQERFQRVLKGERIGPVQAVETRKDGELIEVMLTGAPICDEAGVVVGGSRIARLDRTQPERNGDGRVDPSFASKPVSDQDVSLDT